MSESDEAAALAETMELLNDPVAMADIRESERAYADGDVLRGVEAVRQLRPSKLKDGSDTA